jgi:hypothetical protein
MHTGLSESSIVPLRLPIVITVPEQSLVSRSVPAAKRRA